MTKGRMVTEKKRLLWIGDAVSHTGFATVTHGVLEQLKKYYEVSVLGVNYRGDPHSYTYPIYPAMLGGDVYGVGRLHDLINRIQPHVIIVLNDPWVMSEYEKIFTQLRQRVKDVKILYYLPVDAPNIKKEFVEKLQEATGLIFYTEFGKNEFAVKGSIAKSYVIPHGVDVSKFYPVPQSRAREKLGIPEEFFVVGYVARNQPRKRQDLAMQAFAEFATDKPEARFYPHCSVNDVGYDIIDMARYFGIEDKLILTGLQLSSYEGVTEDMLNYIYNSHDIHINSSLGEGFCLPVAESMSVKKPQIVPEYSALNEWGRFDDGTPAMYYVPIIKEVHFNIHKVNTVGGVINVSKFTEALNDLYYNKDKRNMLAELAYKRITSPEFSWESVGNRFREVIEDDTI